VPNRSTSSDRSHLRAAAVVRGFAEGWDVHVDTRPEGDNASYVGSRVLVAFVTLLVLSAVGGEDAAVGRVAATAPVAWWGFQTPSRNIVCNSGLPVSGSSGLSCVVFSASVPSKGQKTWALTARGVPRVVNVLGNIGTDVRVLAYGRSWQRGALTCVSRSSGLTCRNAQGHGFALSRERQRVF